MSNYTPIVSYGPKDSLSHGDPNKAIKGVQIDAELAAIATAVATKQDTPLSVLTVTGTANQPVLRANGSGTTGQSLGIQITAGTNSSDTALQVNNTSSSQLFKVQGDGSIFGASAVDMTPASGSFVATYSGFTTGVTGQVKYYKIGPIVVLLITNVTGTSNATTYSITNIPTIIRSVTSHVVAIPDGCAEDNGVILTSGVAANLSGATLNFFKNGFPSTWTASGTKGLVSAVAIAYSLQ